MKGTAGHTKVVACGVHMVKDIIITEFPDYIFWGIACY